MKNYTLYPIFCLQILSCAPVATFQGREKMLVLASEKDKCKLVSSQKQWTMLYGSSALNQVKMGNYASDVPYKIVVRHTISDRLITYLGGFLITLGRRTIEMHRCDGSVMVMDKKQEETREQAEKIRALAMYARENTDPSNLPLVVMKNDALVQGRIFAITPDSVTMELIEKIPVTPDINDKDWIYKKDGEIVFCNVVKMGADEVVYSISGKEKTMSVREISKIQFEKKRKEQEAIQGAVKFIEKTSQKSLALSEIKRIELHPQTDSQNLKAEIEKYLQENPTGK